MGHDGAIKVQVDSLLPCEVSAGDNNCIRHNELEKLCEDTRMAHAIITIGDLRLSVGPHR